MTKQEAVNRFVDLAQREVGYHEGENNYNKYAAALDPLNVTYGAKQNQPWCGEFVLWCAVEAFGVTGGLKLLRSPRPSGVPLCATAAEYFKKAGAWSKTPELGDIVFFNVDGGINHTGIVTAVRNGTITTVEGNCSDRVARCLYTAANGSIAGYGRPDWAAVCELTPEKKEPEDEDKDKNELALPLLRQGSRGLTVTAMQGILIARGCGCGPDGPDGDFGPNTAAALRRFQSENGLAADAVCGEKTWKKLLGL